MTGRLLQPAAGDNVPGGSSGVFGIPPTAPRFGKSLDNKEAKAGCTARGAD